MRQLEVIALLSKFDGPWRVYEPVRDELGRVIGQDCIVTHRGSPIEKELVLHRVVRNFTVCEDRSINIYVE